MNASHSYYVKIYDLYENTKLFYHCDTNQKTKPVRYQKVKVNIQTPSARTPRNELHFASSYTYTCQYAHLYPFFHLTDWYFNHIPLPGFFY